MDDESTTTFLICILMPTRDQQVSQKLSHCPSGHLLNLPCHLQTLLGHHCQLEEENVKQIEPKPPKEAYNVEKETVGPKKEENHVNIEANKEAVEEKANKETFNIRCFFWRLWLNLFVIFFFKLTVMTKKYLKMTRKAQKMT